ncbi:amino acid adenylation domain-containing protein [Actinopolyspora mortivallis]|uniref:Peptide synthetase n=1 Tax=Actinopolyspora mortivallis TaxID=33906 RepID=A0A2T0GZX0_ACTMO|nr:amino acid adenylation domain-containing protein [Actinopolyspora mortivallis]PRW64655.1 peptide synthetase [Actinopolyspora mortivallis]
MGYSGKTVVDRFISVAHDFPDSVAVRDVTVLGSESVFTYRELYESARNRSAELHEAGIVPGDLVAVDMPAGFDAVVSFLAVWLAEACYLPLDHFGPSERNRSIVEDAAPKALLTPEGKSSVFDSSEPVTRKNGYDLLFRAHAHQPPSGTAYIIYTSGTTGDPKGVPVTHRNLSALFDATAPWFDVDTTDTWLLFHSLAFDFSIWELWGALTTGGRLLIPDRLTVRDPEKCADLIRNEQVSVLNQTPTSFLSLAPELCSWDFQGSCLRYVVFGGEQLFPRFLRDFCKSSNSFVYNMYGITEITVHATIRRVSWSDIELNISNIGETLPGFTARVVDEHGYEVPFSEVGELLLAGPQVVGGYLRKPELSERRFTVLDGKYYYRSGDLVRREMEGFVYVGRNDEQVKLRGHRIELGEVDRALQEVPGVTAALSVVIEDEDERYMACAYVSEDATDITTRRWRNALSERLPSYMIPRRFARVDSMPRTRNGKIDRGEIENVFRRAR